MTDLKKKIENVVTGVFQVGTSFDPEIHKAPYIDIATQDILSAFKEAVEEIIGKDEDNKHPVYGQSHSFYRNNLKAEQRDRLHKLIGGGDG